ncbi:DUF1593 domain-containing protein [Bremerella alba]|uniref:Cellulose-binding Sde182 nucleoside hydrolase-like domain-containing protein n=1 Tax=Bremerella alba TaxID=980252 RepID=A0A7V9A6U7_9BACT|nr:DUF1593 domain-containing protein [Bremerella alba]MBA2114653.1 hypothetical protein [Bremerella alba]
MRNGVWLFVSVFLSLSACPLLAAETQTPRPRLLVLTDVGGDPDDQQSLVRLMVYANQFRLEGLVASASGTPGELKKAIVQPQLIREIVNAYGQVRPNLARHESNWPEAAELLACIKSGNPQRGRKHIGEKHDTEGSRFLIEKIDSGTQDDRLNIAIWGGQTDLAQALWRVKHDRSEREFQAFVQKFRVYDIADQDGIAQWMHDEFPGMFYILSKAPPGQDKRQAVFRGMYLTGDQSLTSRKWIEENIRSQGPLGKLYPTKTWTSPNPHGCLKEGDTPSWFFFLPAGGNQPGDPSQPGWGGQYFLAEDGWYRDQSSGSGDPRETVSKWRPKFQRDFAQRMAWCMPKQDR